VTRDEVWQEVQRLAGIANDTTLPIEQSAAALLAYERLTDRICALLPAGQDPNYWLIRDILDCYWTN
jgi:hypothetical protein